MIYLFTAPRFCHPSADKWLRYPDGAGTDRTQRRLDYDTHVLNRGAEGL